MAYLCEIKDQPAQPILAMRHTQAVDQLPAFLGQAFGAVMEALSRQGAAPAGPPFAAYYNMDMQALDVEAGFPTAGPMAGQGEVYAGVIPAGRVATCLYTGPYDGMVPAYEALQQYIQEQGMEACGLAYEWYLSDPGETPPAEMQTLIMFPLK